MSYRTHLTLTARHTGLNLGGTRSLAHASSTAYAIHGASILRFRRDVFRSVDGVSNPMCSGNRSDMRGRADAARPAARIPGSASWDVVLMSPGAPWSRSVAAVQKPKPQQEPTGPKRGAVVRGFTPVVRGTDATPCGLAAWPDGTAGRRGERVGTE